MKILNPNFLDVDKARLKKYKQVIETYISSLPVDQEFIDFAVIEADIMAMNLPGVVPGDITEMKLIKICQSMGIKIIE